MFHSLTPLFAHGNLCMTRNLGDLVVILTNSRYGTKPMDSSTLLYMYNLIACHTLSTLSNLFSTHNLYLYQFVKAHLTMYHLNIGIRSR